MAGAAVLSSMGAMRSGAGLVRIAIVSTQIEVIAKRAPLEVTIEALPENSKGEISSQALRVVSRIIEEFKPHVIAVGPGLKTGSGVRALVRFLLNQTNFPIVVDADALNVLSTFKFKINRSAPWILTPHRGEASRLLNCKMQELPKMSAEIARRIVKKYSGSICLLKGPGTLVTDGKHFFENSTGNPAMATAGMGDVLTGIIASLWAQQSNKNVFTGVQAASIGAYLHGLAGDLALKQYPERTLLASDLADLMPVVFRKILKGRKK